MAKRFGFGRKEKLKNIGLGSCLIVNGKLEVGKLQPFELQAKDIDFLNLSSKKTYPFQKQWSRGARSDKGTIPVPCRE